MGVTFRFAEPGIGLIMLDRPARRNAIDTAMAEALRDAVDRFEAEPEARVAILAGAGPVFCAGMDLAAFAAGERPGVDGPYGFAHFVARPLRKPVIAAIQGGAHAGGFEIMLNCDMVIAAEGALFSLPEVKRGLLAGGGGAIRLPRRLPPAPAREMLLTGDPIDATRAHALGLINAVCPQDRLLDTALDLARRVAANAPLAIALTRELAESALEHAEAQAWAENRRASARIETSADALEGARAFTEKRPPVWQGR